MIKKIRGSNEMKKLTALLIGVIKDPLCNEQHGILAKK
jgi:hypothetical protein